MADNMSLLSAFLVLFKNTSHLRRLQFYLLFLLMILSGISQMLFVLSVMPYLDILINPNGPLSIRAKQLIFNTFNHQIANYQFIYWVTAVFILIVVILAALRAFTAYCSAFFAAELSIDLSDQGFFGVLSQPYISQMEVNSSEKINSLSQVTQMINGVLMPVLQFATCCILLIGSFVSILIVNWIASLSAVTFLVLCYALIAFSLRNRLNSNGRRFVDLSEKELKVLQESFGGIRDMLLDNTQNEHRKSYLRLIKQSRRICADNTFLQAFPRFPIEAFAYTMIASIGLILSRDGDMLTAVPSLAVFALAAQSILPNLQQIYSCWGSIRSGSTILNNSIKLISMPCNYKALSIEQHHKYHDFQWNDHITLKNLCFKYRVSEPFAINDLSIMISKGERIGLVGATGSGKTTLSDIFMGLLQPNSGGMYVDSMLVGTSELSLEYWRTCVAHVPQNVYLADLSIARNISIGLNPDHLNMDRLIKACIEAQIYDYIVSLPNGLDTVVGEHGVRLSGGQRQRIGIARALYRNCSFLVLDEATSALDSITESRVMKSICNLSDKLSILIIAHRLSTVRDCDRIIFLDSGKLVDCGTFEYLIQTNSQFRKMSSLSNYA